MKIQEKIDTTIVLISEDIKQELKKQRDTLNCEYSGLPSVLSYDVNN